MVKERSVPTGSARLPVEASKLVGRIVEKGFSSTSTNVGGGGGGRFTLPEPSLLPFPVARHRSHGPHWAPVANEENDEGTEEEEFDPVADFAQPIHRRPKKGLDLRKWKELVPKEYLVAAKTKSKTSSKALEAKEMSEADNGPTSGMSGASSSDGLSSCQTETKNISNLDTLLHENQESRTSSSTAVILADDWVQGNDSVLLQREKPESCGSQVQTNQLREFGSGNGLMSNMDDIDAENNALLREMSADEIAQAQAEIKERIKPEIIELLKRHGRKKLETRNKIEVDTSCMSDHEQKHLSVESEKLPQNGTENDHGLANVTLSPKVPEYFAKEDCEERNKASTNVLGSPDDDAGKKMNLSGSNTWDIWSNRVEVASKLRFTLDGSVVPEGFGQHKFDNVTERDFLRTEGDPGGSGYTIKEAVSLVRSMVPGQRALALQLLSVVLDKALCNLQPKKLTGCELGVTLHGDDSVDWQALWAYAIGPEPELVLTLRMALDDNHASVLVSCVKVIHCILCCNLNEYYFRLSELLGASLGSIYTAPVFRVKEEMGSGFLNGGFWKYSAKPSSILPFKDQSTDNENEDKHTIKDDVVIVEQDIAAGLIRMGVLPRIRYILEMDHNIAVEEFLLSILTAFARHSPACGRAIMECPRLMDTVINHFVKMGTLSVTTSEIKSIHLLMVLSESSKSSCEYFIKNGAFSAAMRHLYASPSSLEQWLKFDRESAILLSAMMVELLRLWKVCICYGYCISYFPDFFPALCLWLSPPAINKLIGSKVFYEFNSVAKESYIVLAALCRRLSYLDMELQEGKGGCNGESALSWSWSHAFPMFEFAMKWMSLKDNPYFSFIVKEHLDRNDPGIQDSFRSSLISVLASVLNMLCCVFEKISSDDSIDGSHGYHILLCKLSKFASNVVQQIGQNGLLGFSVMDADGEISTGGYSFVEKICHWRIHGDYETSISSSCYLDGLVRLIILLRKYLHIIEQANCPADNQKMDAVISVSQIGFEDILVMFLNFIAPELHYVQSIETFYRGGPAPGLGFGWGSYGGGFWSSKFLLSRTDARVVVNLLELCPIRLENKIKQEEASKSYALQKVNAVLSVLLILGPQDTFVIEKAFKILFDVPVLKFLSSCIHHFICDNLFKPLGIIFHEEDYHHFSEVLASHFHKRWLNKKKKSTKTHLEAENQGKPLHNRPKKLHIVDALNEDVTEDEERKYESNNSLVREWAHQRLPLPAHWFLSPLSTSGGIQSFSKSTAESNQPNHASYDEDVPLVVKSGLFFLLGLEAMSSLLSDTQRSPILSIPLVWKLHSLSMVFLVINDATLDEQTRAIFGILQKIYGQKLDQESANDVKIISDEIGHSLCHSKMFQENVTKNNCLEILNFQRDIHSNYPNFVETLVEQFASVSYGDMAFGRQLAIYLHQSVDVPVRLAAWNALSDARVMELLPKIEDCISEVKGFLFPSEDNEEVLEAYAKSWISGCLDRAAVRASVCFSIALHHLSSLFFLNTKVPSTVRNKLVKSLLRDYSRKPDRTEMLLRLIRYDHASSIEAGQLVRRFEILSESCEGNSLLLAVVEKLKCMCASSMD